MGIHITAEQKKNRRGAYFTCATCGKEFYVYPSYLRKAAKRGVDPKYCSMKCYDRTGDNNPFWGKNHKTESIKKMTENPNRPKFKTGEGNPNFVRFGEEYGFLGSRKDWWREKLIREVGQCEKCGFSDERILTLHHKDRNPRHNKRENLMLLCWNCHALEHWDGQDGMYHFMRRRNDKRNVKSKD